MTRYDSDSRYSTKIAELRMNPYNEHWVASLSPDEKIVIEVFPFHSTSPFKKKKNGNSKAFQMSH